jgi:hypothetical protein
MPALRVVVRPPSMMLAPLEVALESFVTRLALNVLVSDLVSKAGPVVE